MSAFRFKLAARTDVGLVRTNNEDNFQVAADLGSTPMQWVNDQPCELGTRGTLLVVADGMGGMNAGEVASEIAVATVREWFAPQRINEAVLRDRFTIERFMNDAIVEADERIKRTAQQQPETRGMGTTLVIAWILDGKLYVSWCGDSRAYIYNPQAGLHQITKDHSYVQQLVDRGSLTREEAFDFPDSNIITRSLSDSPMKAKPESLFKPFDLADDDLVMLCTDGLCGMIRDGETERIIRQAGDGSLDRLLDSLVQGAYAGGGSDNVTICLCRVLSGGIPCDPSVYDETERRLGGGGSPLQRSMDTFQAGARFWHEWRLRIIAAALIFIAVIAAICLLPLKSETETKQEGEEEVVAETLESETPPIDEENPAENTTALTDEDSKKSQTEDKAQKQDTGGAKKSKGSAVSGAISGVLSKPENSDNELTNQEGTPRDISEEAGENGELTLSADPNGSTVIDDDQGKVGKDASK